MALDRRSFAAGGAAGLLGLAGRSRLRAQTPQATPDAGAWSFTDVAGTTVTLPKRPSRIAAYINQAAALWDLGIEPVAVFGWTAANHPEGDHIAWGNVDPSIPQISNSDGNVELEALIDVAPDLIVTWTWDKDDVANATNGFLADNLETVREIAPIIVLNQGDPVDAELRRVEELAVALGADLEEPSIAEARKELETKVAEFETTVAERQDISAIFASFGEPGVYYVAAPDYVADVGYVRSLGLALANDGAPGATEYWEPLSAEQALMYPCDVIYLDSYGSMNTLEALQADEVYSRHPAIEAGQVGFWERDYPATYRGIAAFLESVLAPLREAADVA